jgi:hypothetical protein
MRVVRLNKQATKSVRRIRGFCRVEKIGRITRAQAVALALADLQDQVIAAREYGTKADRELIAAHLRAFRESSR